MIRVLANLDCEARWAGAPLRQHVLRKISAIASLAAALVDADHDDDVVEVWAPAEVDPARLVGDRAWPRVAMTVIDASMVARSRTTDLERGFDVVWASPAARPFNDRRFALDVARHGLAPDDLDVDGHCVVGSIDELERAVRALGGPWVAKALWATAGRDRVRGDGAPTGEQRTYLGRMLDRGGPDGHPDRALVVEPWRQRLVDIGTCARVTADGQIIAEASHTLLVDPRGGFGGIDLAPPPVEPHEHATIVEAVHRAGEALAAAGFRGPYAIDSFVYTDGDHRRVRALVEINARHTFGHVARALAARAARCGDRDTHVTLPTRLGFTPLTDADRAIARVLVEPTGDDPTIAWLA